MLFAFCLNERRQPVCYKKPLYAWAACATRRMTVPASYADTAMTILVSPHTSDRGRFLMSGIS